MSGRRPHGLCLRKASLVEAGGEGGPGPMDQVLERIDFRNEDDKKLHFEHI